MSLPAKNPCIYPKGLEFKRKSPVFYKSPKNTFERRENRHALQKLKELKPHDVRNRQVNRTLFNVGRWNDYIPFLAINTKASGYKVVEYSDQAYVIYHMCELADSYGCGERAYGFSNLKVYQPGDKEDIKRNLGGFNTDYENEEVDWDVVPILAITGCSHYDEEGRREKNY